MKQMNKLIPTLFLFSGIILSPAIHAGGGSTGGGGSFVCKKDGKILSAISLDLWDTQRKYELINSILDEQTLSRERVALIPQSASIFRKQVQDALEVVIAKRDIRPYKILPVGDSKHKFQPGACPDGEPDFEPAALYDGSYLTYSSLVWEKMDNLSQAALNIHEAVYKILRDEHGDKTSERTIQIVGFLFSKKPLDEIIDLLPTDTFNPQSSKTYSQKYQELLGRFNLANSVTLSDVNQKLKKCAVLENIEDKKYVPQNIDLYTLTNHLEKDFNKKGKYRGLKGIIRFKEKPRQAIFGAANFGEENDWADPGKGIYIWSQFKTPIPNSENPELGPLSTDTISCGECEPIRADISVLGQYLIRKNENNDLIILKAKFRDVCLEFHHKLFNQSCKTYQQFNVVRDFPNWKVEEIYFCPRKD